MNANDDSVRKYTREAWHTLSRQVLSSTGKRLMNLGPYLDTNVLIYAISEADPGIRLQESTGPGGLD